MQRKLSKEEHPGIGGTLVIRKLKDGKTVWQSEPIHNKVVTGAGGYGRNIIARQLAGDTTYAIEIDSFAIGDDNTAPVDGDTALGNSLVSSISITDYTVTNNVLELDVFVPDGDLPNDTYEEIGFFCNGRLFSRLILSPAYVKASGEDSLFTYTLTISG